MNISNDAVLVLLAVGSIFEMGLLLLQSTTSIDGWPQISMFFICASG